MAFARVLVVGLLVAGLLPEKAAVSASQHSDEEFVRNTYRAILCREGDEAGVQEKLKELRDGQMTRAQLIMVMRFSDEYQSTSTYLSVNGNTNGECGGCSVCKPNVDVTRCCPGTVQPPPEYSENAPDQSPFFQFAPDESCADCLVACPKGWASMEPNTGPAKCNGHEQLECCSPQHAWGSVFLVCFFGFVVIYVVAGTVYGFQHGKDGVEALPNVAFWRDVSVSCR